MVKPSGAMSPRKEKVLNIIVRDYIQKASPVASESIVQRYGLGVSPATIRNDMARLEQVGFLQRSHVSSGAIPTDRAYRFYVERLDQPAQPPVELRSFVWGEFNRMEQNVEVWTRQAAALLAHMVRNVAITTFPRSTESRIKHLELVQLQEFVAMVILVLQEARLRQQLLHLNEGVTQGDLGRMANKLNSLFAGMTYREVRAAAVELSPLEMRTMEEVLRVMETEDSQTAMEHSLDGLHHILDQPEFSSTARAREAMELLEDKEMVKSVVVHTPQEGIGVVIGAENQEERLHPFSVVICQYGVPGKATGVVAAIGPTRMEYGVTIASVRYMAALMSKLVGSLYGEDN